MKKILIISALVFKTLIGVSAMDDAIAKGIMDAKSAIWRGNSEYRLRRDFVCVLESLKKYENQIDGVYGKLVAAQIIEDQPLDDSCFKLCFSKEIGELLKYKIYAPVEQLNCIFHVMRNVAEDVNKVCYDLAIWLNPTYCLKVLTDINGILEQFTEEEVSNAKLVLHDSGIRQSQLIDTRYRLKKLNAIFGSNDSWLFMTELCDFFACARINIFYDKLFMSALCKIVDKKKVGEFIKSNLRVVDDFLGDCVGIIDECFVDAEYDKSFLHSRIDFFRFFVQTAAESPMAKSIVVHFFSEETFDKGEEFFCKSDCIQLKEMQCLISIFDSVAIPNRKKIGFVNLFINYAERISKFSDVYGHDETIDLIGTTDLKKLEVFFDFLDCFHSSAGGALQWHGCKERKQFDFSCVNYIMKKMKKKGKLMAFMQLFVHLEKKEKTSRFQYNLSNFLRACLSEYSSENYSKNTVEDLIEYICDHYLVDNFRAFFGEYYFSHQDQICKLAEVMCVLSSKSVAKVNAFFSRMLDLFYENTDHYFLCMPVSDIIASLEDRASSCNSDL